MKRISILFIITQLELGGAQKQLLEIIGRLDKDKYDAFLFTAREGILLQDALAIDGLKLKRSNFLQRRINPLKDFLAFLEIYSFIAGNGIKVVHTHSSKAGIIGRFAARLAGAGVIVHTVHGWSFNDSQLWIVRSIYSMLERAAARFTRKIITVSYFDRDTGVKRNIAGQDKFQVVRYGIDFKAFSASSAGLRQELKLPENALLVGMVACFKSQKSPLDFLEIARHVCARSDKAYFVMAGDGVLRRRIESAVKAYGLEDRVFVLGWRRDMPSVINSLDVLVLTSLWEGLPICVLEALVSGKPVVATDTGGIREVVSEGDNGFLVRKKDVGRFVDIIGGLLSDKEERERMAAKAAATLGREFTSESMALNTSAIYESLLSAAAC